MVENSTEEEKVMLAMRRANGANWVSAFLVWARVNGVQFGCLRVFRSMTTLLAQA